MRSDSGIDDRILRTLAGSGSAVASFAAVADSLKRPRFRDWLSSEFHPPCFIERLNLTSVGSFTTSGSPSWKTALRGTLRRPGPASMFQALISNPSMANATSPKTRRLPSRSGKRNGSSQVIGGLMSAVAFESVNFFHVSGSDSGAISTSNSVSAAVPRNERPGPLRGSLGSLKSSSRKALTVPGSSLPSGLTTLRVGA